MEDLVSLGSTNQDADYQSLSGFEEYQNEEIEEIVEELEREDMICKRTLRLTTHLREEGVDPTLLLFLQLPQRLLEGNESLNYVRGKAEEMRVPLHRPCVYRAVEDELKSVGVRRIDKTVIVRLVIIFVF
jgi:hypothetical protein